MDASEPLSNDLATLTQALDRDGIDLVTQLDELAAGLRRACLGMTITISGDGDTVTFSARDVTAISPPELPLTLFSPTISTDPGSSYVRFESAVDVYIDIGVDTQDSGGVNTSALSRDKRAMALSAGPGSPSILQRCSAINQAIGVLLERGRIPEEAHESLARLANFGRTDLYRAAEYLLRDLASDHHPTDEGAPAAA